MTLCLFTIKLLAIFNLDAENEGVKAFLVDFHFSPLELKMSVPSSSTFGIGYILTINHCYTLSIV